MEIFFVTFLDVLVLVERFQSVVLGESTEGVYQVGAEIRIDVLRGELGRSRPIDRPICVVTHDLTFRGNYGRNGRPFDFAPLILIPALEQRTNGTARDRERENRVAEKL